MASGCIMGYCPVCEEIVWEDNCDYVNNEIMHPKCALRHEKINAELYTKICEAKDIKSQIEDLKQTFKESMDFYNKEIARLENELKKLQKG